MATKLTQAEIDKIGGKWTINDLKDVVAGEVSADDAFKAGDKISKVFDGCTNGEVLAGCIITIMRVLTAAKSLEKELKDIPKGEAPN